MEKFLSIWVLTAQIPYVKNWMICNKQFWLKIYKNGKTAEYGYLRVATNATQKTLLL